MSYKLRIILEYFQPKIGRRIRIFSLGRKNNILILKKECIETFALEISTSYVCHCFRYFSTQWLITVIMLRSAFETIIPCQLSKELLVIGCSALGTFAPPPPPHQGCFRAYSSISLPLPSFKEYNIA